MQAYSVRYHIRGREDKRYDVLVDAKDAKSAKRKIGRKHGYKDGRLVVITGLSVVGYF